MTRKSKTSRKNSPVGIDEILKTEIREEPPILINGVLPAGGGMLLGGESEVGKSLMRVEWSILLASGLPVYGMRTPHAQTVLVFQTENSAKTEQFRTKRIMQGYGIESCHNRIFYARPYRKPSLLDTKFLDHAEQQIRDSKATVAWWDPLVSFHNRNENDNVAMRNVLDAITYLNRKTGAASIVIHHFGQPGKQGGYSQTWSAQVQPGRRGQAIEVGPYAEATGTAALVADQVGRNLRADVAQG